MKSTPEPERTWAEAALSLVEGLAFVALSLGFDLLIVYFFVYVLKWLIVYFFEYVLKLFEYVLK